MYYSSGERDVVLPPMPTQLYASQNEPQAITRRTENVGYIYADSTDPFDQDVLFTPQRMIMSNRTVPGDAPGILAYNVRRLVCNQIGMNWVTPNVIFGWNDEVVVVAGPVGGPYTRYFGIIPQGFYDAPGITAALQAALNAATTGVITWVVMRVVALTEYYTITPTLVAGPAPAQFYFPIDDLGSKALNNGEYTFGLDRSQTPTIQKTMFPQLYYTRYVDFTSDRLTQYAKMLGKTTHHSGNVIARLWLTNPPWNPPSAPSRFTVFDLGLNGINWEFQDPLSSFDITILDEFGNLLILPNNVNPVTGAPILTNGIDTSLGKACGFQWTMNIRLEL